MANTDIINVSALLDKCNKLANIDIMQALELGALVVEADAKVRCPADDGILRMSITHVVDASKKEVAVGTNTFYAP